MIVFRWILAVLTGLLMTGGLVSFVAYMITGDDSWNTLARRFGRWVWAACLFWFNVEIWGRVLWTLFHWNS